MDGGPNGEFTHISFMEKSLAQRVKAFGTENVETVRFPPSIVHSTPETCCAHAPLGRRTSLAQKRPGCLSRRLAMPTLRPAGGTQGLGLDLQP